MLRLYQGSFAGGEISPSLLGQTQFAKYAVAAAALENMIVEPFGSLANRPGMRFHGLTKNNEAARLIKFEYSAVSQYLLEFGDFYIKVWLDSDEKDEVVISSPYSTSLNPEIKNKVWDIKFAQSADYMFICCPDVQPHMLIRLSDTDWKLLPFTARLGPFMAWNTEEIKIKADGFTGIVNLSASAPIFNSFHAGQLLKLRHYVPRKSIGPKDENEIIKAPPPRSPNPEKIPVNTEIFDEFREFYDCNVSLQVSGFWSGALTVHIWDPESSNPERNVSFDLTNTIFEAIAGRPKNQSMYIGWFDDVSKRGRFNVKVKSEVTINGIKDNQIKITVTSQSNYMTYEWPLKPLEEIPVKKNVNKTFMDWRMVKGSWSFTTSGIWSGLVQLERSTDGGGSFITVAEKASEYDSANANFAGAEIDDGVLYRLRGNITVEKFEFHSFDWRFSYGDLVEVGVAEITEIINNTNAVAVVQQQFGATEFTADWAAGSWFAGNWPQVCMLYQDRLVFANSPNEPQTVWASRIGDYENFGSSLPLVDDDSINVTLAGGSVHEIRSIVPAADLVLMTNSAEFILRGDATITPLSVSARPQSFRGSSGIDPVIIGNSVVYVSKDGCTVRDFAYSLESDGYDGRDRSILAGHIFKDEDIIAMTYQQEPWSVLWVLGANGTLASLTYVKEHDVWAWARHVTDGEVVDLCCVYNDVFFLVRRGGLPGKGEDTGTENGYAGTKNGYAGGPPGCAAPTVNNNEDVGVTPTGGLPSAPTNYSVESIGRRSAEGGFLDSSMEYDGGPVNKVNMVSGLDHLVGRLVSIVADGFVLSNRVVAPDGSVDLVSEARTIDEKNNTYNRVIVGLPYSSSVKTLPAQVELQNGSAVGCNKKITSISVVVNASRGFLAGDSYERLVECDKRLIDDPLGSANSPKTGIMFAVLNSDWNENGSVVLVQRLPLPFEILGIEKNVEIGG